MSQLPTPKEAETPLGFADQKSCIKTAGGAELDAAKPRMIVVRGRVGVRTSGEGGIGRVQVSGPIGVRRRRLHLPKLTAQKSTTSPVVVDYSIITCARVASSHLNLLRFKIHTAHKRSRCHEMLNCSTALILFGFVAR